MLMLNLTIFLKFFCKIFKFLNGLFSLPQCFSLISLFLWCLPIAAYMGLALRRGYCHKPCTATVHRHPTLLCMDVFETVIECTATDHMIFSQCIYISFHGNLLPLA